MEGLKSYFSSIDPRLFKHVSGKPKEFIEVFRSDNFISEEAFAQKLLGAEYSEKRYAEWKSRTVKILQSLAIVSDVGGGSLVKKKYDKCNKNFLLGQKFLAKAQRKEGLRLIKQAYTIAVDYDFSHLACELASILHHHHTYYQRNKKMSRFYAALVKTHLDNYAAEKEAEFYFYQIVVEQMHSQVPAELLREAIENLSRQEGDSIKYKVYKSTIKVLYALYKGKYNRVISYCTDILDFLKTRNGAYPAHYLYFLRNKGTAQTATAKYEEALASFKEAEQYTSNRPYNAYTLKFYQALNAFHAGHYQKAYDIYQKNKRCKFEDIRQHFAIIEAYLCFLNHTGFLQLNKTFRMGKYLNDTFKAQEDKQGNNINILIAELLVYLVRNRGKFIDRVEAIQHYSYRHLKGPETRRAKWFLKILCLMAHPKVNFHPVALCRKAERYLKLLEEHPLKMGENFAIEIIPFEKLLEMILKQLQQKVA